MSFKSERKKMKNNNFFLLALLFIASSFYSCNLIGNGPTPQGDDEMASLPTDTEGLETATFAGGCFWCTEAVFERVKGVKYVISGYSGGYEKNPTYKEVSYGKTTHAESIQVYYDPEVVSFDQLLEVFFLGAHDPTQVDRQGPDKGKQYRSIAFYRNQEEKTAIDEEIKKLNSSGKFSDPIATEVMKFEKFYPAEKYHQDYYPDNMGNPYVQNVSRPKVEKFEKNFSSILKDEYK
jgi:peptide-methionine (S)-S-oxide reductase